jgi:predicted HTH transcriptional regulator
MLEAVQQRVKAAASDNVEPPLPIATRLLELPDEHGDMKSILHVDIEKSLFVHSSNGRYFHRVAESKQPMKQEYLARVMMQRSQSRLIWLDERPVPGTQYEDLDKSLYRKFLREESQPDKTQLRKLRMLVSDNEGHEKLSVSGVLLGTPNPGNWLPNAFIQAVCYSGEDRHADQQLDAMDFTGPLDQQISGALSFVEKNQRVAAKKLLGREDLPQYSLTAVFEALVNAVAHRDYDIYGAHIRLHMFADRLILCSPGALVNTMEVDELMARQASRNQLITSLLARCPYEHATINRSRMMDKRGEGVPVIMSESESLSGKRPDYQMAGEELQLTIYAAQKQAYRS